MGYDLYGMNPKMNTPNPSVLLEFQDEKGWVQWDKMTDKDKKEYHDARDKHQEENPGEYYRANVWYWRPVWNFVCAACDDFLSNADMEAGCSNSGDRISKTKSLRIASRLRKLDKLGIIQTWEDEMMIPFEKAQKNNDKIQKEMDSFQDLMRAKHKDINIVPANYPKEDKEKWDEIYSRRDWGGSYPPSRQCIVDFASFCHESGGFEIC